MTNIIDKLTVHYPLNPQALTKTWLGLCSLRERERA